MKFCRIVCGMLLALAICGIAPASAGSPPPIGVLRSDARSQPVAADSATAATPDASETGGHGRWDAKDIIIVVAAVGFVLLLVVGAFAVKRRGES